MELFFVLKYDFEGAGLVSMKDDGIPSRIGGNDEIVLLDFKRCATE